VNPGPIVEAIAALGEQFLADRYINKPLKEFLLKSPPDLDTDALLEVHEAEGDERLEPIIKAVNNLNSSILTVQGPPGTGKTFTASHVIQALLKQGKSVGVTSNGHKAIDNLMIATYELCEKSGEEYSFTKVKGGEDELFDNYPFRHIGFSRDIWGGLTGGGCLIGATAWGFSQPGGPVDYLFVDEAGQVSLAKLAAMSAQAKNIICLGDQMQLPQPIQGTHPGDSACSILDYFLMDDPTVMPDRGIFLNRTYRMHREVNDFISEAIYGGRLGNDADCDRQEILLSDQLREQLSAGIGIQ
jgi:uncharacterized protein